MSHLREKVSEAIAAKHDTYVLDWSVDSDGFADTAIATVLAEIDAELERRIGERDGVIDRKLSSGSGPFVVIAEIGKKNSLVSFRSYIRALGEGGDDAGAE